MTNIDKIRDAIRNVPDFPKKGIEFKDLTTVFKDAELFRMLADLLYDEYKDKGITKVVGIESRGFILGTILAYRLGVGFVLIRKPNKLPAETFSETYELEYGSDTVEIHKDSLNEDDVVLVHDDLLATGGTMKAAINLIKQTGVKHIYTSFIVELSFLNGRELLDNGYPIHSIVSF